MTKTLTEQWREGTLEQRYYYVKYFGNGQKPFVEIELKNFLMDLVKVKDSDKIEVLESVPSYEEYQDIIQQNVNQEAAIETYIEDIKRLQEQLNEANKTIKKAQELCPDKNVMLMCNPARQSFGMMTNDVLNTYLEKWGVK